MHALKALGHRSCHDRALRETLAGKSLVFDGDAVVFALEAYRVDSGHLPHSHGSYSRILSKTLPDDCRQGLRRTARSVQLVDMVLLDNVRLVAAGLT